MTDRYKNIRRALAMGPTPGPWSVRYDYVVQAKSFDEGRLVPVAQPYGVNSDGTDLFANAALIAACDPDTIRALLAERDELAKDAARYRWLRKGANDDVAVVRGLGAMDYGMSAVVSTYSEEIDGDDLDAAIDAARSTPATERGA